MLTQPILSFAPNATIVFMILCCVVTTAFHSERLSKPIKQSNPKKHLVVTISEESYAAGNEFRGASILGVSSRVLQNICNSPRILVKRLHHGIATLCESPMAVANRLRMNFASTFETPSKLKGSNHNMAFTPRLSSTHGSVLSPLVAMDLTKSFNAVVPAETI